MKWLNLEGQQTSATNNAEGTACGRSNTDGLTTNRPERQSDQ
jgi:hypothetical protein